MRIASGLLGVLILVGGVHVRGKGQTSDKAFTTHRPAHTYSIVARDPATGEMGVAVQSHWFSVGSIDLGGSGSGCGSYAVVRRSELRAARPRADERRAHN